VNPVRSSQSPSNRWSVALAMGLAALAMAGAGFLVGGV